MIYYIKQYVYKRYDIPGESLKDNEISPETFDLI